MKQVPSQNVLGSELAPCGMQPKTGFYRDGSCQTGPQDMGTHTVCAIVDDDFLAFSKRQGNDLITPVPQFDFPGLKAGDRWCLCAARWKEARSAEHAPKVVLHATHAKTLDVVSLDELLMHAIDIPINA